MRDEFDIVRDELADARLEGLRWVPGAGVQARRRAAARSAIAAGVALLIALAAAVARLLLS